MWISADRNKQFWSPYSYVGNGYNPVHDKDIDGYVVIAGDAMTEDAYPGLLKAMSQEARERIAVLEKSRLVYTITIAQQQETVIFDENGKGKVFTTGGQTKWTKTGANIEYTKGDAASLAHELAGHGFQRELATAHNKSVYDLYAEYLYDPVARIDLERDAYTIAGQNFSKVEEEYYRRYSGEVRLLTAMASVGKYLNATKNMSSDESWNYLNSVIDEMQQEYSQTNDPKAKEQLQAEMRAAQLAKGND